MLDLRGRPLSGARIDVWSDNADGFYDVQPSGVQPKWNNRSISTTGADRRRPAQTGADGRYSFVGNKPVTYPFPHDGPV